MKKKLLLLMTALFLIVIVLFTSSAWWRKSSKNKKITLSVLWFNDGNESEVFMNTIQDYLDTHRNLSIDLQLVPFQEYEKRLKIMIAGGTPPDLARVTTNHVVNFQNQLLPLNGRVKNFDRFIKNFSPASVAFGTTPKGNIVAIPTEATANGMLVNLDYFKKAGIDIKILSKTWTWDQWYDAMKKVVAANNNLKYALGFDFSPHRWSTLLYEAGGGFLNADGTAMDFVSPETIDALNFFKKLHDEGLIPKSVWMGSENPQELFIAGIVASHIGGSWLINKYASDIKSFEWAAVQMPKRKLRSSVVGGKFIAAFKGAENEDEAIKLMLHFSDKKHNAKYCLETYNLSARTDVNIKYPNRTADFAVMAADLAITPAATATDWKSPAISKIYSYIREQIVEGLMGKKSMEEVAQAIQDKGNNSF